jgi:molybdate/tungstate transport system permease protein
MKRPDISTWLLALLSLPLILLLTLPLVQMTFQPSIHMLVETICDREVLAAISRSIATALSASFIAFVFGTPLAYILARKKICGKKIIEGIIDLPIMIPHPVVGIAILSLAGRNHPLGQILSNIGIRIMGTWTGIITVLVFVGLPFYINTVKAGFENVPQSLEKASRSLGAGALTTFLRITFPLSLRHIILGFIMCTARAISEFGAVVIVAYHPMTATVMIYERFTAYGLKYSQPIAVWLIIVSFALFVALRLFSKNLHNYR